MTEPMAGRGPAPEKRYRLTIELDAHDLDHALQVLQVVINDAHIDGLPSKSVSSAGYVLEWIDRNPGVTREQYEAAVEAWFAAPKSLVCADRTCTQPMCPEHGGTGEVI